MQVDRLTKVDFTVGFVCSDIVHTAKELVYEGEGTFSGAVNNSQIQNNQFQIRAIDLKPETKLSFRAYLKIGQVYYYGAVMQFTTQKAADNPQAGNPVDLGLPSGTKWADRNITGQDGTVFFPYGKTTPTPTGGGSIGDTWAGFTSSALRSKGVIDATGNLSPKFDAARYCWGGKWRTPTVAEFRELLDPANCNWVVEDIGWSRLRYTVVSKVNGNSISFEPEGFYYKNTTWIFNSHEGAFWTSTVDTSASGSEARVFCILWANGDYFKLDPSITSEMSDGTGWELGPIFNSLAVRPVMSK